MSTSYLRYFCRGQQMLAPDARIMARHRVDLSSSPSFASMSQAIRLACWVFGNLQKIWTMIINSFIYSFQIWPTLGPRYFSSHWVTQPSLLTAFLWRCWVVICLSLPCLLGWAQNASPQGAKRRGSGMGSANEISASNTVC